MRKMKKRFLTLFILMLALGCLFSILTPTTQQTLDAWQDDVRMLRQKVHYRLGWPLPGTPALNERKARLKAAGLKSGDPVFIRIFKLESQLELWMKGKDGFKLFATYPICRWSGALGPKLKEGDRQSPEGIYTVAQRQLNPNSRWFKSFNLGYPNIYDKSFGRTGSFLMVHGGCSSIGCYAMTNPVMKEIWDLIRAAYNKGQKNIMVHAFPFHMTERNLRVYSDKQWASFWQSLKPAYDMFNQTQLPPMVSVCKKEYQFQPAAAGTESHEDLLNEDCSAEVTASNS